MYNMYPYMLAPNIAQTAIPSLTKTGILGKLSLSSILSGTQKALNLANQAIPLYKEVKPMIANVKTLGRLGKELNKISNVQTTSNISNNNNIIKEIKTDIYEDVPSPTFFI